jgi:hypothetical protein
MPSVDVKSYNYLKKNIILSRTHLSLSFKFVSKFSAPPPPPIGELVLAVPTPGIENLKDESCGGQLFLRCDNVSRRILKIPAECNTCVRMTS